MHVMTCTTGVYAYSSVYYVFEVEPRVHMLFSVTLAKIVWRSGNTCLLFERPAFIHIFFKSRIIKLMLQLIPIYRLISIIYIYYIYFLFTSPYPICSSNIDEVSSLRHSSGLLSFLDYFLLRLDRKWILSSAGSNQQKRDEILIRLDNTGRS